jgi:phospholipase C
MSNALIGMAAIAVAALVGCGGGGSGGTALPNPGATLGPSPSPYPSPSPGPSGGTPFSRHIKHVVIIFQENRSFDNLFNGFPGADTAPSGPTSTGAVIALVPVGLESTYDLGHMHADFVKAYDGGKNDGFDLERSRAPYQYFAYAYVPQQETQPYYQMAASFVVADRMFQSNSGPSFPAHQYLIAGQSANADGDPLLSPWGCDAPPTDTVTVLDSHGIEHIGPFPCFEYPTIADLLDSQGVLWRYYAPPFNNGGEIWSAFDAVGHVRYGRDWAKVVSPETTILTDVANGNLAPVTWVMPTYGNSDHSGVGRSTGPQWVASVVNAIGGSQFWSDTAIFVTWDDWGGWYDHVPPQQLDVMGLGFRVPLLVVSPWARHGYVSHVNHEFGSILKMTEETFGLGSLGAADARADDLFDCFDFTQTPQPFRPFAVRMRPSEFVHHVPDYRAPDD